MTLAAPQKVILVDDQLIIRQGLEDMLQRQPGFFLAGVCGSVQEAIELIHTTQPDLLLLDIELPDGTGFDILEKIPEPFKVIFFTAHREYAPKAFRYGAIDYLLKPVDENELKEALQKVTSAPPLAREQIDVALDIINKNKEPDLIVLRTREMVNVVKIKDICYLQSAYGCITFFLRGGKKLFGTKNLSDYEDLLPGTLFMRTHQSYLVNRLHIDRYHSKSGIIYLNDATQIPVSDRKKEIIDRYFKTL